MHNFSNQNVLPVLLGSVPYSERVPMNNHQSARHRIFITNLISVFTDGINKFTDTITKQFPSEKVNPKLTGVFTDGVDKFAYKL